MRMRTFGVFCAAMLLPVGIFAQDIPKPAPEMSQLAHFEGSWTCQGKMNESPFAPAGEMQGSAEITRDLGGFWQSGIVKGTSKNMPPMEGRFHTTYDPAAKRFVMLWVDNMGGWAQSTSSGWKGDTLVYEGEAHMGPQKMRSRDTFTRSGAGTLKHAWEAEINGKWVALGEETCRKK